MTGRGEIHQIGGIVVALGGFYLFSGATWAPIVGIVLAVVSAVIDLFLLFFFFFLLLLPYYQFWSLLMIALAVSVIWSLSRPLEARP